MQGYKPFIEGFCRSAGLPLPAAEVRFHPTRKWKFDFCWEDLKVALEIEGGVYAAGRHTRGSGFEKDIEKYNTAGLMGWLVIRASTGQLQSGQAWNWIEEALKTRGQANGQENSAV